MKESRDNSAHTAPQHSSPLTPQAQSDRIAELLLANAQRLANDPEVLARIKKLSF